MRDLQLKSKLRESCDEWNLPTSWDHVAIYVFDLKLTSSIFSETLKINPQPLNGN